MEETNKNKKKLRILTGIIGFPIVALILIFGNVYIIDILMAGVAILTLNEYYNAFQIKLRIRYIGYMACMLIALIHILPIIQILPIILAITIAILFLDIILTNMKSSFNDIVLILFGICYITLFIGFIPLIYGLNNGKFLIWYIFFSAWGTDTFAYFTGMKFGKHRFTQISPKKTIEGCIGGIVGSTLVLLIYTAILNKNVGINLNYIYISIIGVVLSVLSQIGDLSASTIKRTVQIKDFGNIIPGHGGMLDRIDSILFIAPFTYLFLTIMLGG